MGLNHLSLLSSLCLIASKFETLNLKNLHLAWIHSQQSPPKLEHDWTNFWTCTSSSTLNLNLGSSTSPQFASPYHSPPSSNCLSSPRANSYALVPQLDSSLHPPIALLDFSQILNSIKSLFWAHLQFFTTLVASFIYK